MYQTQQKNIIIGARQAQQQQAHFADQEAGHGRHRNGQNKAKAQQIPPVTAKHNQQGFQRQQKTTCQGANVGIGAGVVDDGPGDGQGGDAAAYHYQHAPYDPHQHPHHHQHRQPPYEKQVRQRDDIDDFFAEIGVDISDEEPIQDTVTAKAAPYRPDFAHIAAKAAKRSHREVVVEKTVTVPTPETPVTTAITPNDTDDDDTQTTSSQGGRFVGANEADAEEDSIITNTIEQRRQQKIARKQEAGRRARVRHGKDICFGCKIAFW